MVYFCALIGLFSFCQEFVYSALEPRYAVNMQRGINTCYASAALQAFIASRDWRDFILNFALQGCAEVDYDKNAVSRLQEVINDYLVNASGIRLPVKKVNVIPLYQYLQSVGKMESCSFDDALKFIKYLDQAVRKIGPESEQGEIGRCSLEALFYTYSVVKTFIMEKSVVSGEDKYEEDTFIMLNMPSEDRPITLSEAINHSFINFIGNEAEQRRYLIHRPRILCFDIALKNYQEQYRQSGITIPQKMDLTPWRWTGTTDWFHPEPEWPPYRLVSVVFINVTGRTQHYVACVRYGKTWYLCNDLDSAIKCPEIKNFERDMTINGYITLDVWGKMIPTVCIYEQIEPIIGSGRAQPKQISSTSPLTSSREKHGQESELRYNSSRETMINLQNELSLMAL